MNVLISVYNKDKLDILLDGLKNKKANIYATKSTLKHIKELGFDALSVEEYINFPEILNGRVKTLHPKIFGGILHKDNDVDKETIKNHKIISFDLVVCNLYPFYDVISKKHTLDEAIENIDIGGVSLLRATAKNFKRCSILVDSNDYYEYISRLNENKIDLEYKKKLSCKAFYITSSYDYMILNYLSDFGYDNILTKKIMDLRYGENPHQKASLFKLDNSSFSIFNSTIYQGKELSYNNILDINSALDITSEHKNPFCVAIKHNNPTSCSEKDNIYEAYLSVLNADSISIFGGIICFNKEVDEKLAKKLTEIFLEVIIAPSYTKEALEIFKIKKNLRVLSVNMDYQNISKYEYKSINGGLLKQEKDNLYTTYDKSLYKLMTNKKIDNLDDLEFGLKVIKYVKSNAIILVKDKTIVGVGSGQVNRVQSIELAIKNALNVVDDFTGVSCISDGFFPFVDNIELLKKYNINVILQPGGSISDNKIIEFANNNDMVIYFSNRRYFKH